MNTGSEPGEAYGERGEVGSSQGEQQGSRPQNRACLATLEQASVGGRCARGAE